MHYSCCTWGTFGWFVYMCAVSNASPFCSYSYPILLIAILLFSFCSTMLLAAFDWWNYNFIYDKIKFIWINIWLLCRICRAPKYNRPSILSKKAHILYYNSSLCLSVGWRGDAALAVCNHCLSWNTQISIMIRQSFSIANKNNDYDFFHIVPIHQSPEEQIFAWFIILFYLTNDLLCFVPFFQCQCQAFSDLSNLLEFLRIELRKRTSIETEFHLLWLSLVIDLLPLLSLPFCSSLHIAHFVAIGTTCWLQQQ